MPTHSSILAWRIPWMEKPGRYSPWSRKESDTTEKLTQAHTHTQSMSETLGISRNYHSFGLHIHCFLWACFIVCCHDEKNIKTRPRIRSTSKKQSLSQNFRVRKNHKDHLIDFSQILLLSDEERRWALTVTVSPLRSRRRTKRQLSGLTPA